MKKLVYLLLFLLNFSISQAQTATFQITYHNASPQAQQAIDQAAAIWSNLLLSNVPIKMNVHWVDATGLGFLGFTIANGVKDFSNAPMTDVWYPSSLGDAIAGTDNQPMDADIDIFLDSTRNWYYGFDAQPATNQFDLIDVTLHEIGHGLGFYSIANMNQQGEGSFSLVVDPLLNILASFPIPDLQGKPLIYDLFVENQQGDLLTDTMLFPNPSLALATAFTNNQLYFNGTNAMNGNNNNPVRLYAPGGFAFGSSVLHLNESTFSPGTPDAMMTPFSALGEAIHHPGARTLGVLQDIGWNLNPTTTNQILEPQFSLSQNYPNPFNRNTTINFLLKGKEDVRLSIYNILGEEIRTLINQELIEGVHQYQWNGTKDNGQPVPTGMYIYQLKVGDSVISKKMLIK